MDHKRLQNLQESAPGKDDGWLPAGMCKFSVIVIGLATAGALFAAWAKTSNSAGRQTPAVHAPPATERSSGKATSRITRSHGKALARMNAAERPRQDAVTAAHVRAGTEANPR